MKASAVNTVAEKKKERTDSASKNGLILFWCMVGLIVPRGVLYGEMAPFGISLAAASAGLFPLPLAVLAGYLFATDILYPVRYMAAVLVVMGSRWVLAAIPGLKDRPFVPPLLSFSALMITGVAVWQQYGLDGYRMILLIAESAVAAGCACFFRMAMDWSRDTSRALNMGQQAAVVLTAAIAVMAISTMTVFGFSPGRAGAVLLVLLLARSGQEAGGSIAGVIFGAAVALASPGQTVLAVAMAFGGLIAGVFSRMGRLAEAASFFIASGVVTLLEVDETVMIHAGEIAAAGVLFVILPKKWDCSLGHLFIKGRDLPAVEGLRRSFTVQLRVASRGLTEVGETVTEVSEKLSQCGASDICAVMAQVRREVCVNCPLGLFCWEQNAEPMRQAWDSLLPDLQRTEQIQAEDMDGFLQQHCRQKEKFAAATSDHYRRFVARQTAWERLREIRDAAGEQFAGMSKLLDGLAEKLDSDSRVDTELSGRVQTVCADFGIPVKEALCFRDRGNRLTVDIVAEDTGLQPEGSRWIEEIQRVCGREFATPRTVELGNDFRLIMTEPPRYTVEMGCTQLCCGGEKLCGDAVEFFPWGIYTVAIISDGMGCGGRAAVDGAMTAGLTARLWKAGFSADSILHTVNAALMMKSREESLATLDMAVIDGFSGRVDCFKAGAAATLLKNEGRVSRLEQPSLPLGILPQVQWEHLSDRLIAEDILLMMSDGVLTDGMATVEKLLRDHPQGDSMQALTDRIATAVRQTQTTHQDDITVVALRMHLRSPRQ